MTKLCDFTKIDKNCEFLMFPNFSSRTHQQFLQLCRFINHNVGNFLSMWLKIFYRTVIESVHHLPACMPSGIL